MKRKWGFMFYSLKCKVLIEKGIKLDYTIGGSGILFMEHMIKSTLRVGCPRENLINYPGYF